ncbi:histamine H4 receptor isoform X2 [Pteronotus mesoamericanus]|uniref:histamine H4 receptor isoform X2 n=1 Tax=Pteronotus mesoamericanus TaxID=1884717 RepID=UPI0023EAEEC2|nr:histamine H4 receptor isoform X2 [Pteronotus parnellii mesoamericanus]
MSALNSTISSTVLLTSRVPLAFLMGLLAFAIMLGNAIVILAFVVDKNLRHRSNCFFLNLAISDFFVVSDSWKTQKEHCSPGFISKWYVLGITSLLEFLAPLFLVAYFNIYIYWSLWKQRSHLSRAQSPPESSPASSSNSGHLFKCGLFSKASLAEPKEASAPLHLERQQRKSSLLFSVRTQRNRDISASKAGSFSHSDNLTRHQKEYLELLRARKLAKSLAILLGVFILCWAPFSLFTFVRSIYSPGQHAETFVYDITFWLQWCNSFVNPFLYPLCHKRFQKAFLKIFCVKKQLIQSSNRSVSS